MFPRRLPRALVRPLAVLHSRTLAAAGKGKAKRPDWMVQAEREAMAATQGRAGTVGSPQDVMMNKLEHEFATEGVYHSKRMQDKLTAVLKAMDAAHARASSAKGASRASAVAAYNALRKKALASRQDLVTQRESAGLAKDANGFIEAQFPIKAPLT